MHPNNKRRTFTKIPVVNYTPTDLKKGVLVFMNNDGSQTVKDVYIPLELTRNVDKLLKLNWNDKKQNNGTLRGILKNRVQATEGMSFQDIAAMYFDEEKKRHKRKIENLEQLPFNMPGLQHRTESKKLVVTFRENQKENPNINLIRPKILDLSIYTESLDVISKDSSTQIDKKIFTSESSTQTTYLSLSEISRFNEKRKKSMTVLIPKTDVPELIDERRNFNINNERKVEKLKRKRLRESSSDCSLNCKIMKNKHIYVKDDNIKPPSNLLFESTSLTTIARQSKTIPQKLITNDDSEEDAESLATIIEGVPPPFNNSTSNGNIANVTDNHRSTNKFKPFARMGNVLKVRDFVKKLERETEIQPMTDKEVEELESEFEESRSEATTFHSISNLVQAITSDKWVEVGNFLTTHLKEAVNVAELWPIFSLNKGKSELTIIYQLFSIYESQFFEQMKKFSVHYSSNNHIKEISGRMKLLHMLTQMDGWKQFCSWEEDIRRYINEICDTGSINSVSSLGASYVPRSHINRKNNSKN
ncbi:hypothetical protein SNEBB_009144 [Seison nebaliae]|nr:hypothetical protein SNEBB_009144 [Seison nebaliae]